MFLLYFSVKMITILIKQVKRMLPTSLTQTKMNRRPNIVILFSTFLLVALIVRLAIISMRWINPDQVAHLMDARLLL